MVGRPRLTERDVQLLGLGAGAAVAIPEAARRRPSPPKPKALVGSDATRVLGLDLSIGTTGWCLLVAGQPMAHGSFHLPDRARHETLTHWLGRRAVELARLIGLLVTQHRPELVAYEYPDETRPAWSGGSKGREFAVVQGLARAEGFLVAQWPSIAGAVTLTAVPVTVVKRVAAGRVNASKDQVRWSLLTYRRWDLNGWTSDEVDAAAVALAAREGI